MIAGTIGAFFIPSGGAFGSVWMYFGMVGGFLFILIQLILIIDFAHSWAENWVGRYEETDARGWYAALLSVTFGMYIVAIVGFIYLFINYTQVRNLLHPFSPNSNVIFFLEFRMWII